MKLGKQIISILFTMLMFLQLIIPAGAAPESGAVQAYKLPRKVLLQRVADAIKYNQIRYVNFYNIGQASCKDLQEAAASATRIGGKVFINFDTLTGDEVTARITVNPLLVKREEGDICLTVDTSENMDGMVKVKFEKLFEKPVAVLSCGQAGDFGMTVVISGKLDLSGLNKERLIAYSYDLDKNEYTEIKNAKCMLDDGGFVSLQTSKGGYIVITSLG